MSDIKSPKKLIEVALPLDDINAEAAREKSIRHGHPSTLHLWWARRPLAAARAVLFAQMVNDPGGERGYRAGLTKQQAAAKRELLFDIIRDLVKWENINNEEVLERARIAIRQSWRETCEMNKGKPGFDPEVLPAFHDPFAGGGAIPLEAQRLGLESYASDLNPVPVMINKAMIEIPPKFANIKPIGPIPIGEDEGALFVKEWKGSEGLAEDVRRYGIWMKEEAQKRIGHLYPDVEVTADMAKERPDLKQYVGKKLKVIAWLWARTVKSPNPQFSHIDIPLISSFVISKKKGHEAYVCPIVDNDSYRFEVKLGKAPKELENGTKAPGKGSAFNCLISKTPIPGDYVKAESMAGRMGERLFAIVCEGEKGRIYISPNVYHENIARGANPQWCPSFEMNRKSTDLVSGRGYGFFTWGDLFTKRQLLALNTFSDLAIEVCKKVEHDCLTAGFANNEVGLADGGCLAKAYSDAISIYLTFLCSQLANHSSSFCGWNAPNEQMRSVFARQAIPMTWDFAEVNLFSNSSGSFNSLFSRMTEGFVALNNSKIGFAGQFDAQTQSLSQGKIISTDPPYYDNIAYADLSDFFYVWLRRSLRTIYPDIFATMVVPKKEELIAAQYRHGTKEKAEMFFLDGMTQAMHNLAEKANRAFPVTIYYAFKASDECDSGVSNTGWETFLSAVLKAGFMITGTWPMRTEKQGRVISNGTNALASSIVLVCRKRDKNAQEISRRDFLMELRQTMPNALSDMLGKDGISSPIAPVDLAQAAIGPGMEIFSKYKAVLNSDGTPMSVHEAMIEINRQITDYLNPDGSGFDPATLFCNDWFMQYGWNQGPYGDAETLARAKGTTVGNIKSSGAILAEGGKVQIMNWKDYPMDYDPSTDRNRPTWEACHHMIRVLNQQGEQACGALLAKMSEDGENIRQLAYYLYTLCERKGNAEDARYYNELMTSWHAIVTASMDYLKKNPKQEQLELF